MKKRFLLLPILGAFALTGCDWFSSSSSSGDDNTTPTNTVHAGNAYDYTSQINLTDPDDIVVTEPTGEFAIAQSDGLTDGVTVEGNVYTITKAGTFTLSGKLEGQVVVNASSSDVVEIDLEGVSISYNADSPIKVVSADKVEISAKKGTENMITDTRSHKSVDSEDQGEGALSAKTDLKLKGAGTLVVSGNYNNGVHTTKDLTIQKLTLKTTGYNNAIKGKDSVTITSGTVHAYAQTGNGIKTEDSDVSDKGNQRGTISVNGGYVYVNSLHDGLDASYNVEISEASESTPTTLFVKCGKKSSVYSSSTFVADSEKGLKAANEIIINSGKVQIAASDDAIHANYGDVLENSETGLGNITVNGGVIQIASGDDGLHADNTLNIKGGTIYVTGSKEGLEANYIVIDGGSTYVYGSDDGVNAAKKSFSSCSFTMNDGYLDIAIASGDTDGIDSNGTVTIAGGTIITRGSPGTARDMSTGLDVDGACTITGGTLIAFNGLEKAPSAGTGVKYAGTSGANSGNGGGGGQPPGGGGGNPPGGGHRAATSPGSYTFPAGNYTLKGENIDLSFANDYGYEKFCIYSSSLVSSKTYTLARSNTTVKSWTQSSNSVTIS